MDASQRITSKEARNWLGMPVCTVLRDGTYYLGIVTGVENGELILSGTKGLGKWGTPHGTSEKAQISGFLGSLFGGGAGAFNPLANAGAAGGIGTGGMFGSLTKMWPAIRFGLSMLQTIIPLFGGLKI